MIYAIKDLKKINGNIRFEIHKEGCKHLVFNSHCTTIVEAENIEKAIEKDDGELYNKTWSPKKYRIAPCVK